MGIQDPRNVHMGPDLDAREEKHTGSVISISRLILSAAAVYPDSVGPYRYWYLPYPSTIGYTIIMSCSRFQAQNSLVDSAINISGMVALQHLIFKPG